MRLARVLERNRLMKGIAKKAAQRVERAVVHSIDGNRVNIRLNNSPTLVRYVEVAGDIGALKPNLEVPIIWKERRPVVLAGQPGLPSTVAGNFNPALAEISARVIRTSNQAGTGSATTPAAITFDTAVYDTCGMFDINAPTQLAIRADGMYLLAGAYQSVAAGANHAAAIILLNGDTSIASGTTYTSATAFDLRLSVSGLVRLHAGDFVELWVGSGHATRFVDDYAPTLTIARLYE